MILVLADQGKNIKNVVEKMNNPIQNQEKLIKTVKDIALKTSSMSQKILGKTFPIKSLTVFSHSQSEFELLIKILSDIGKPYNYNNGPRVELYEPITVETNIITHLRIRKPDPDRPQIGCNDFATNYQEFKKEYLTKYPENLNLIERPEYEMVELHDPEFDVFAYIVSIIM